MTAAQVAKLTERVDAHDEDLRAISDTLVNVIERLDRLERTVDGHTGILNQHTATLDQHTATLDQHTATLDQHTGMLTEILEILRSPGPGDAEGNRPSGAVTVNVHGVSDVQPRAGGPFRAGDRVQLTDPKGRHYTVILEAGAEYHTHRGGLRHDDLIGRPEGSLVVSPTGTPYLALRPRLADYVLSMPRGAQVIYPKDAAQILMWGDVFPGARVLEAGAGSGALSCSLLRAVGPEGQRRCPTRCAPTTPSTRCATSSASSASVPPNWALRVADLHTHDGVAEPVDRVVLDMLRPVGAPRRRREVAGARRRPGRLRGHHHPALPRWSRTLREQRCWTEPQAWECLVRPWHVGGPRRAPRPPHAGPHGVPLHGAQARRRRRAAPAPAAPDPAGDTVGDAARDADETRSSWSGRT